MLPFRSKSQVLIFAFDQDGRISNMHMPLPSLWLKLKFEDQDTAALAQIFIYKL